jgi:hypothetical protein
VIFNPGDRVEVHTGLAVSMALGYRVMELESVNDHAMERKARK